MNDVLLPPTLLALTALASLAVGAGCGEAAWPPGLSCAEESVDFGEVWEGAVLEHEFTFRVGPLGEAEATAVDKVRADCGCTATDLELERAGSDERVPYAEGDPLVPGDRLHVGIEYHTRGKKGRVPRVIKLYAEDGNHQVEVVADVSPLLLFEPLGHDVGLLREDHSAQRRFTVRSADGRPFALTPTGVGTPEGVVARAEPAADAEVDGTRADRWDVELSVGPGLPLGPHLYTVELESDFRHDDGRAVAVKPWVHVKVISRVELEPQNVDFGAVPQEELVARTLRLTGHDEVVLPEPRCRLEATRDADAPFAELAQITVQAVPDENAWDIQVLLPPLDGRLRGTFLGTLVVETGHPEEPRITAALHGLALQRADGR